MTSKTWLNADGTRTAEIHAGPIFYKAQDGSWQPIDTTLSVSPKAGFAAANTTNVLKTYLPAQSSGWTRVEDENASISFRPMNPTATSGMSVNGDESRGVAWANTTLSYKAQPDALKGTITLAGPGAPASFSFALALDGLTATLNKDNSVTLSGGSSALSIPAPWMKDAAGKTSTAIQVTLVTTAGGLVYSMTPDPAFLATAVYPVAVDPSITGLSYSSVTAAYEDNPPYPYFPHDPDPVTWTPGVDPNDFYSTGDYMAVGADVDGASYDIREWSSALEFVINRGSGYLPLDADVLSASLHVPYAQGTVPDGYGDVDGNVPFQITDDHSDTLTVEDDPPWIEFNQNLPGLAEHLDDVMAAGTVYENLTLTPIVTYGVTPTTVLVFDRSQFALNITYNPASWYTFQGNARRTGRTFTAIPSNAVGKWVFNFTQAYKTTTVDGQPVDHTPALTPSVLAFPDPLNPNSPYPALIVETSDGIGSNFVYRLTDFGTSSSFTNATTVHHLDGKVVSGTPLLYGGKLFVPANDPTPTQTSPNGTGYLYILDGNTLQPVTLYGGAANPVQFDGPVYSSPAPDPRNGGILVCVNEPSYSSQNGSGYDAYLHCIDASYGIEEPGWTPPMLCSVRDGDSSPAPIPPGTYSSPGVYGGTIYIGDSEGWTSAFDAQTGAELWRDGLYFGDSPAYSDGAEMQGSSTFFTGNIFVPFRADMDTERAGALSAATPDRVNHVTSSYPWFFDSFGGSDYLGDVYTTPALFAEKKTLLFGDDHGTIFGVGTEEDPLNFRLPTSKWTSPFTTVDDRYNRVPVRCSPLIAAPLGAASATAFVAGGETTVNGIPQSHVYAFDAETGTGGNKLTYPNGTTVEMNGKVRSSMAAWNGRLYVLSTGTTDNNGNLTGNAQLFCFGAP